MYASMILGNVENYFKRPPSRPVTTARDKIDEQILIKSASERTPNDTLRSCVETYNRNVQESVVNAVPYCGDINMYSNEVSCSSSSLTPSTNVAPTIDVFVAPKSSSSSSYSSSSKVVPVQQQIGTRSNRNKN